MPLGILAWCFPRWITDKQGSIVNVALLVQVFDLYGHNHLFEIFQTLTWIQDCLIMDIIKGNANFCQSIVCDALICFFRLHTSVEYAQPNSLSQQVCLCCICLITHKAPVVYQLWYLLRNEQESFSKLQGLMHLVHDGQLSPSLALQGLCTKWT